MSEQIDLQSYITTTIPNSLAELSKSHSNINQIAQYCKSAYDQEVKQDGGGTTGVFSKTQNYIKDALANVAYHIHNVGNQLNTLLLQQTKEIARLDVQLHALTDVR